MYSWTLLKNLPSLSAEKYKAKIIDHSVNYNKRETSKISAIPSNLEKNKLVQEFEIEESDNEENSPTEKLLMKN